MVNTEKEKTHVTTNDTIVGETGRDVSQAKLSNSVGAVLEYKKYYQRGRRRILVTAV